MLAAGHFAVTSEWGPPRSADGHEIEHKGKLIKDHVDAINVTDNQTSVCRLCSLAAVIRLKLMGLEPVLQMVTRDRNRIALQSDILGAASFGINNILCLTGDHQHFGDHPKARQRLRPGFHPAHPDGEADAGRGPAPGRLCNLRCRPQMFIGAAANPFAGPNVEMRVARLAKKATAGVQFIQTQCIYNMDKFKEFMELAVDRGCTEQVAILAGITPMKTVGMARYMQNRVPGMDVPDEVVKRIAGVPKDKQADEGITFAIEQIEEIKERPGHQGLPHHGHRVGGESAGNRRAGGPLPPAPGKLRGLADTAVDFSSRAQY